MEQNKIQVFNNTEFGNIRSLEIGGEPWFVGKDVATAVKAAEEITGQDLGDYLPKTEKTYSASEVGNALGISANKVGKIANAYGLKTEEYGVFVMDKSRYSSKEVTSFCYNEKGKAKIREILKEQ